MVQDTEKNKMFDPKKTWGECGYYVNHYQSRDPSGVARARLTYLMYLFAPIEHRHGVRWVDQPSSGGGLSKIG